jgi:DNA-binding winged helix-turn-helix (wHTH) protein
MSAEICRFAEFEIDRGAYQLRRDGHPLKLERIPLDLLFLLIDRRGQLVTREEILESIWGRGLFLDVDNAINSAVRKIRRALREDLNAPRFVVTVPAKGYRFIAKVTRAIPPDTPVEIPSISQGPALLMVGRETELARLQSWSRLASEGQRRVVFVVGEAGIGKTTFLRAFLDSLGGRGVRIGRGQCVEQYGAGEPYMPMLEALSPAASASSNFCTSSRPLGSRRCHHC